MNDKIKYEECINRINEITSILTSGDVELEQSITLYKEAVNLLSRCREILADAESRITEISVAEEK